MSLMRRGCIKDAITIASQPPESLLRVCIITNLELVFSIVLACGGLS